MWAWVWNYGRRHELLTSGPITEDNDFIFLTVLASQWLSWTGLGLMSPCHMCDWMLIGSVYRSHADYEIMESWELLWNHENLVLSKDSLLGFLSPSSGSYVLSIPSSLMFCEPWSDWSDWPVYGHVLSGHLFLAPWLARVAAFTTRKWQLCQGKPDR